MKVVHSIAAVPDGGTAAGAGLRPSGIEIQYLLAFVAVYEARNVTTAARRIRRSQSAISHSLSKLRVLMDDELFVVRGG